MRIELNVEYTPEGRPRWMTDIPIPLEAHLGWLDEPPSLIKVWLRIKHATDAARQINIPLFAIAGGFQFVALADVYEWIAAHKTNLHLQVEREVGLALDDIVQAAHLIEQGD